MRDTKKHTNNEKNNITIGGIVRHTIIVGAVLQQVRHTRRIDLLNYDATYYVGNDFMLTYNGKTYRMETKGTEENPELILGTDRVKQSHIAYFGTLDGDKEYDTDFILTWKDGSQDVIHFTRKINDILDTEDQWLLNGEKVEQTGNCGVFTITR